MERDRRPVVVWDISRLDPDAVMLEALLRSVLHARRCGFAVRLNNASVELRELIAFVGLCDLLSTD